MREIRLYDTRSGELLPLAPARPAAASASTSAGRPSTPHPRRQRAAVRRLQPAQALPRARGLRGHAGDQRHRRQRQDLRRRARAGGSSAELAAEMTAAYFARHRRARPRAPRPRAARERVDRRRSSRRSRRCSTAATPTRPTATSTSACARTPATARSRAVASTTMDQGEGVEGAERKEDPLDFALWKAHKPGEDTSWDVALGAGAARAGTSSARRWPRRLLGVGFDIHGGGSTCSSPTTRTRRRRRARRAAASSRGIWMHNGMLQFSAARRWPSRSATSRRCTRCSTRYGRDAVVIYLISGPLPPADRLLRGGARPGRRQRRADPRGRPAARRRAPVAGRPAAAARPLLRRARRRLQHAEALAAMWEWIREANRQRRPASATATCARCSACSASRTCSSRRRRRRRRGRGARRASASGARAARDYARADELRDRDRGARLVGARRARRRLRADCRCE